MPARLLPSQALAQMRSRDAQDSESLSHTGPREKRKWETKPKVENPSSVARSDWRPRPLCNCAWTAALRVCGAAGHSATGTHTHPRPPSSVPCHHAHPGASRCGLRLAGRHAMEHPPTDTLSGGPGALDRLPRQSPPAPGSYLCLCPSRSGRSCPAALEPRVSGSDQQGRRRGPRLELRSTGGSRPGAARGAGRAAAAGQPGKRSSGGVRWPHRDRTPCPGRSWVSQ